MWLQLDASLSKIQAVLDDATLNPTQKLAKIQMLIQIFRGL